MLVRAGLVLPRVLAARVERLLPRDVLSTRLDPGRAALAEVERLACDLVVAAPGVLGRDATRAVARLRAGDRAEVVVLGSGVAPGHASLLAAGCLAVLDDRVDDEVLGQALHSLVARQAAAVHRPPPARDGDGFAELASTAPAVQRVLATARRVAPSSVPVLLLGETGVGKERLARAIHAASGRAPGAFVAVNGAALPEALAESELFGHAAHAFTGAERVRRGAFELAHRGTLFLDEVGDLPLPVQAKLLRVVHDGEVRPVGAERAFRVDARLIAATNRDLDAAVAAERFRADLLYRLNAVTLELPPLRGRRGDIVDLARRQVASSAERLGKPAPELSAAATAALLAHSWPGNVRELVHVVERAVLLCDGGEIGVDDLGFAAPGATGPTADAAVWCGLPWHEARARAVAEFERRYLDALLRRAGGRIGVAAARAGLSARAVFAAMRRHGLHKEAYREPAPLDAAGP